LWPRLPAVTPSVSTQPAGGAGRLDFQRFQDLLLNSSDPDPCYELNEQELTFGTMILDIAIQVRKRKKNGSYEGGFKIDP